MPILSANDFILATSVLSGIEHDRIFRRPLLYQFAMDFKIKNLFFFIVKSLFFGRPENDFLNLLFGNAGNREEINADLTCGNLGPDVAISKIAANLKPTFCQLIKFGETYTNRDLL